MFKPGDFVIREDVSLPMQNVIKGRIYVIEEVHGQACTLKDRSGIFMCEFFRRVENTPKCDLRNFRTYVESKVSYGNK